MQSPTHRPGDGKRAGDQYGERHCNQHHRVLCRSLVDDC